MKANVNGHRRLSVCHPHLSICHPHLSVCHPRACGDPSKPSRRALKGFTLIEALITLSLVAIIMFMVIPHTHETSQETKKNLAQIELIQQVGQAQQVSLAKMTSVAICLSNDGKMCAAKNASMLISFIDTHNDGIVHEGSQIISSSFLEGAIGMHLRSYPKYRDYLLILPVDQGISDNGTIWHCNVNKSADWAVTVSQLGEAQVVDNVASKQLPC